MQDLHRWLSIFQTIAYNYRASTGNTALKMIDSQRLGEVSAACLASCPLYGQQWWPAPIWCHWEAPSSWWLYWADGMVPPGTSLLPVGGVGSCCRTRAQVLAVMEGTEWNFSSGGISPGFPKLFKKVTVQCELKLVFQLLLHLGRGQLCTECP